MVELSSLLKFSCILAAGSKVRNKEETDDSMKNKIKPKSGSLFFLISAFIIQESAAFTCACCASCPRMGNAVGLNENS